MTEDDKALAERLREEAADWDEPKRSDEVDVRGMLHNAADRIERLEAALLMIAIPRVGGGQWASEIARKVMGIGNDA